MMVATQQFREEMDAEETFFFGWASFYASFEFSEVRIGFLEQMCIHLFVFSVKGRVQKSSQHNFKSLHTRIDTHIDILSESAEGGGKKRCCEST
jgi:hypothetical protein